MKKVVGVFVFFVVCVILFFFAFLLVSDVGPSHYSQQQGDQQEKYINLMDDYLSHKNPDVKCGHIYVNYLPRVRKLSIKFILSGFYVPPEFRGRTKIDIVKEQGVVIGLYAAAVQDGFQGETMEVTWHGENNKVTARFIMTNDEAKSINLDNPLSIAEFCRKAEQRMTYT